MTNLYDNRLIKHKNPITFGLLLIIFVASIITIKDEMALSMPDHLLIKELIVISAALLLILFLVYVIRQKGRALRTAMNDLLNSHEQLQIQSLQMMKAKRKFGELVKHQFEYWQLTDSEKDMAILLLKGLSLKEISSYRNIKEKSARQQASNLYAKTGLSGRHALSAWFFEDLI